MEEKTEGIVLRALDYKEHMRILTLFSEKCGVISLIIKDVTQKKISLLNLSTPLCRGEYIFRRGKTELYPFVDGSINDMHLQLRDSFDHLNVAGQCLQALLTSQMPHKPAPSLFALTKTYLQHLPSFTQPKNLLLSFYLKILRHEGLLDLRERCSRCNAKAMTLSKDESLCLECAPSHETPHSLWSHLLALGLSRDFNQLRNIEVDAQLENAVVNLFNEKMI